MVSIESILHDARQLQIADRLRLARVLFEEVNSELQSDETATGEHGLAAWTDSVRDEDWSAFYPADLHKRRAG